VTWRLAALLAAPLLSIMIGAMLVTIAIGQDLQR
jgi:hypothetical protein